MTLPDPPLSTLVRRLCSGGLYREPSLRGRVAQKTGMSGRFFFFAFFFVMGVQNPGLHAPFFLQPPFSFSLCTGIVYLDPPPPGSRYATTRFPLRGGGETFKGLCGEMVNSWP